MKDYERKSPVISVPLVEVYTEESKNPEYTLKTTMLDDCENVNAIGNIDGRESSLPTIRFRYGATEKIKKVLKVKNINS